MKAFVLLVFVLALSGTVSASDEFSWLKDDSRSASKVLDYLYKQNDRTHLYQKNSISE